MKSGLNDISKVYYGLVEVDKICLGTEEVWINHDYSQDYLTFVALENGTFKFSGNSIDYSIDDGQTWTSLPSDTDTPTIAVGDKILWKASSLTASFPNGIGKFIATGEFEAQGNIMSLVSGDSFDSATTIPRTYQFAGLFIGNAKITNAEKLVLPATTLPSGSYTNMFQGCTSLTTAPELPATTLQDKCYQFMFSGCTGLVNAPRQLSATTLGTNCCDSMFKRCTSLTTAPELPASTMANSAYTHMFDSCTSLTAAPELPATTLANSCYEGMFASCTSLTTAPELPATTLVNSCYSLMFASCTSLTTAPKLPATTLAEGCYNSMFRGCTNLNDVTSLATDISANNCTANWLYNVSATGTFRKNEEMSSWTTGASGIPDGWTVKDTGGLPEVPFLFNYNAKEYDATTYTLPQTDGQLIAQDAVITGTDLGAITHSGSYITITSASRARAIIESALIARSNQNPTLTIISKAKTSNGHSIFANRNTMSSYNYMYRQYPARLTLHGGGERGGIGITDSTQPTILSARVDSGRTLTYNNWTESTTSFYNNFDYGSSNTIAALFNGYASNTSTEEWGGDFYWIYLSTETLTDEEVQQVIDYNENL